MQIEHSEAIKVVYLLCGERLWRYCITGNLLVHSYVLFPKCVNLSDLSKLTEWIDVTLAVNAYNQCCYWAVK